ncbi:MULTISPECIES: carbohydrate ABC transporter permease [unclassified Deinococcus]|uniref:carbohydrate ABC transporter permease n=1 Tax=unclassified Deinococcus TaxID=2623546 RepID=UPI0006DD0043|nr:MULTISPECIES: carbohydrate ABC transporter permease [unclassified Deinococcus]MCD0162047.1 carbohydrate ABC transporter permease [Deinococcus sp. 6YEL10]MCD0169194.1 carbohydrate ABC transporter permease [Deinococcus sp. 23YEL01]MCD0176109.1 carbohydrate ABC transporter permease [Deinococcus sp. 14RED07]OOV15391.1 sugar ABC transporter permease [Deinococcus sp. LM3]PIG99515.1 carbohydrate ABC transporter permease [Deinococcus sp. UR1]
MNLKNTNPTLYYLQRAGFYLLVLVIGVYLLAPFFWAVLTSLRSPGDLFLTPLEFIGARTTFGNYADVFANPGFQRGLIYSLIVAVGSVAISLLLGAFSAYALGRFRFKGKTIVMYVILAVSVFPQIAVLSGLYTLINNLGLYNNPLGLILSYLIFTIPFTVWVLTSFVRDIPGELEEAALVDGASPLQTLFLVLFPVMMPALVTTGLLAFINAWNEYLFALTFTSTNRTVPVVIANYSGATQFDQPWGQIMAASIVVTVPLIILVLVFQRNIVSGLTAGAVKG